MQRISVVGNSGSGTTTVAEMIAERLGVVIVELDGIMHEPGSMQLPVGEFRRRYRQWRTTTSRSSMVTTAAKCKISCGFVATQW